MLKKEKITAMTTGICLFIIAALFSISIFLGAFDFGAEETFLYAFGSLITSVYGFCSILIPVFLFTAGSFCFSETWSVKKACILLVSLVPFFTLVFSEHIIRNIIETDSTPAAAMKIFTVVSIAILLVIAEFLLAIVLAGHFHDKLAKAGTGKKVKLSSGDDTISISEEEAGVIAGENSADDSETEDDGDSSGDSHDWSLADILAKKRKEIQKVTDESVPIEETPAGKYDSLWGLDEEGNVKTPDSKAENESNADSGIEFEDYGSLDGDSSDSDESVSQNIESDTTAKVTVDGTEEPSEDENSVEEINISSITDQNDEKKGTDKDETAPSVPILGIDTSNIKEVDLIHLDNEPQEDDDIISQFEKENMKADDVAKDDLLSSDDEFAFVDEDESSDDYESEIPFDDFDESQAASTKRPETNIDRLLDNFEQIEDSSQEKKKTELKKTAEKPSVKTEPSVFSQLSDVFSKMDEDAEAALENEEVSDPIESADFDSSENENQPEEEAEEKDSEPEAKKPKVAPLVLKRRPPYKISTDLLTEYKENPYWEIDEETKQASANLMATLKEFNIEANVTAIRKGPVVTMFEMLPAPGVKLSKIQALQDNIALRLAAKSVRIVAPIPGKRAVGIEVPNKSRAIVSFRECIEQNRPEWKKMQVPVVLGKDIEGETQIMDLVKTPHLLIAGSTGAGKSVCVNSMILSILYKRSPNEVKMILIDPKIVELSLYNGIGHLLTPVITEPKMAMQALQYCLCEMERRYAVLKSLGCRDILSYNQKIVEQHIATEKLPYIIVVVDEFADLMATTGKQLEAAIARLAAKARAIGIHLVLATQRPSVDVITGLIKANIPSRIAFMVSSKMDSRIIIDQMGAEKLLGKGDMLYASSTDPFPVRIQGALVSDQEVENVVNEVKNCWGEPEYIDDEIFVDEEDEGDGQMSLFGVDGDDPLYEKALDIVVQAGKASASYIQRRLSIGYNRAARLVEIMEERGIVGPANGSKPREIIHIP